MINISKDEARKYILTYQNLSKPRTLESDEEILNFIRKVGCIQYDPLKTTARNADLVLQSRCKNYSEQTLYRLLYEKRQLLDGWDKVMSIWPVEDWPYFQRKRKDFREKYEKRTHELEPVQKKIKKMIGQKGFVFSKDINSNQKVDWSWAPATIARAALESMYHWGELIIHHKEGSRKYYGLAKNLLPPSILKKPDPNQRLDDFHDWYVKRRIAAVGLLWNRPGPAWLGSDLTKDERMRSIKRLLEKDQIAEVRISEVDVPFYLLKKDLGILDTPEKPHEAAIVAPLDNLMWDRNLLSELFEFDYKWEVYTPVKKRKYGYYVLPILYQDRFIARCEPILAPKKRELLINNWWWETGVVINQDMTDALTRCFRDFAAFLDAGKLLISRKLSKSKLGWLKKADYRDSSTM